MNLSKSKYCSGLQCKKMLWLDEYKPEVGEEIGNDSVLENGTEVGTLAKNLFGSYIDIKFNKNLNKMIEETQKVIEENPICNVTEASFLYNKNFCSVDILKKNKNKYEIYEVKSSTEVKDVYIEDASYQYYVLTKLGYLVEKVCIVYINNQYVRRKKLDLKKLFKIEDITFLAKEKIPQIEENIKEIQEYMEDKTEREEPIDLHCMAPYECPYFSYCTRDLEKPNIFSIYGMQQNTKFSMYKNGIYTYKDLLKENLNGKYLQQIDFELNNRKPMIEKDKVQEFLDTLTYPLYFLDFETFSHAIPEYEGEKPYEKIPFQYSLHYIEEKGQELKHKEFLGEAGQDPRRSLAEQLVTDIPMNICTLAYNMSFEKSVIKSLSELYPDLQEHLMNIHDNIKDLMIPFRNRVYYVKEMQGSYSIKYVLPALFPDDPSLNYHNLEEIHNGGEAMNAFANMSELSKEEQESLRYHLLKYCELDTYAMVKIYEKLQEVVQENKE